MMAKRPDNLPEMRKINGIGKQKLAHYGQAFLDTVLQYPRDALFKNTLSETINDTLYYHSQGMNTASIAKKRGLTRGTVLSHFSEAIVLGLAEPRDVLDISPSEYEDISNALELHNTLEDGRLKSAFDELNGRYDYGILRCVLAGM